jgi:hypothetical protein
MITAHYCTATLSVNIYLCGLFNGAVQYPRLQSVEWKDISWLNNELKIKKEAFVAYFA